MTQHSPATSSESVVVCVLGMHRSGTSAITRLLNLLGVYLGEEASLLPPRADNLAGFWEHREFVAINDAILERLGGSWAAPPHFEPDWWRSPVLADLHDRARALVEQDFAGRPLWGWKDPRTCLTVPFWREVIGPLRFVVCLRNPAEVAASLRARDGFSEELSLDLWSAYLAATFSHSAGSPRCVTFYEDYFVQFDQEVARLAQFLGCDSAALEPDRLAALRGAVHDELRHHQVSPRELVGDARVGLVEKTFYLALWLLAHANSSGGDSALDDVLTSFGAQLAAYRERRKALEREVDLAAEHLNALRQTLIEQEVTVSTLQARLEARTKEVAALQRQLAERERWLAERDLTIATQRAEIEEQARVIAAVVAECAAIKGSYSWQLTAPLRWALFRIQQLLGRVGAPTRVR